MQTTMNLYVVYATDGELAFVYHRHAFVRFALCFLSCSVVVCVFSFANWLRSLSFFRDSERAMVSFQQLVYVRVSYR
jgi:organic radical activating enzyme